MTTMRFEFETLCKLFKSFTTRLTLIGSRFVVAYFDDILEYLCISRWREALSLKKNKTKQMIKEKKKIWVAEEYCFLGQYWTLWG